MPGKASGRVRNAGIARIRKKMPENPHAALRPEQLSGHLIATVHSIMMGRRSPDPMEPQKA
jgi:hypothetical protein